MLNVEKQILKEAFFRKLNDVSQTFDKNECMIMSKQNKGYHSSLENNIVHIVSHSIDYAAALLYSDRPENRDTAIKIVNKILSLQDTNKTSPTYGIWPYFLEEPLDKMKSPDWNWADFIGKVLIQLLIDHKTCFPNEMIKRIETAVYYASESIMIRNIGPDYTNINLMGAFVTVKAGELLNNDVFISYGKARLKKELEFVTANGGFSEYNSPTYSILAIEEIGRMLKYFSDSECLHMAHELNDIEWRCIANHYHSPTKQLSAPHSRCYANISDKNLVSFIHIGTEMKLNLIDNSELSVGLLWNKIVIKCPDKYYKYFEPLSEPRLFREKFYKGIDIISEDEIRVLVEKGTHQLEATTYMNQYFSLGSFAKYDLWNQRRPLMAYWGTPEECSYLKLRCMHDDQDYCSAMLSTSQMHNHVVGGVYFVKDHGDYHFILDPLKDGKINAKKLSLKFEIGGFIDDINIPTDITLGKAFDIKTDQVDIRINLMFCSFGNEDVKIVTGKDNSTCWVEIIIYQGEEKIFDFNQLSSTAFVFGLSIFDRKICIEDTCEYKYELDNSSKVIKAELYGAKEPTQIEIPLNPSLYITDTIDGQIKKVKCGGFVYEKI